MISDSSADETRSSPMRGIAFALFAWAWQLLCVWISSPNLNLPHASTLKIVGGIGINFPGFLAINALCLCLMAGQSLARIAWALAGMILLFVLANHATPVFGKDGTYGGVLWLFDLLACLSAVIVFFAGRHWKLIKRGSCQGESPGPNMHWGVAVGLGLFALTLLDTFMGGWAIDLWLSIRHHLGWRFSALPLYFASEAFDGLLIGFAFTWISRASKTAFLFPLFCVALQLAAFSLVASVSVIVARITQWPGMILSEPLGVLAGGGLALLLLRRKLALKIP